MPLKLNASFCKKVPAEVEFSSKSYLASLELELPTNLSGDELIVEIHKTYAQLEHAVMKIRPCPRLWGRAGSRRAEKQREDGGR